MRKIELDLEYLDHLLFEELALDRERRFYVAFSGGMDSTVLLHAMVGLREQRHLELTALHLDHGLQAESEGWSIHCSGICKEWDVPYESERIEVVPDKAIGVEASARKARYHWLQSRMPGDTSYLLTAHHQRDQAETFLLNLLRGSGVDGLSASTAVMPLGPHRLVRPFLGVSQQAIDNYARNLKLEWITDPSNSDKRFRRNSIRETLIPVLKQIKPDAVEQVSTAIGNLQDVRILLDEIGAEDFATVVQTDHAPIDGSRGIVIGNLPDWSEQRFANLLRYWLRTLGYPVPDRKLMARLQNWRAGNPRGTAILGHGDVQFRCFQGVLYVLPVLEEKPGIPERVWNDPAKPLSMPEIGVRLSCDSRLFSCIADDELVVRARQGGERLSSPGNGFSRDLRKYYQDRNIPPWLRFRLPLVFYNGELVAIPGLGQFGSLENIAPEESLLRVEAWSVGQVPHLPSRVQ